MADAKKCDICGTFYETPQTMIGYGYCLTTFGLVHGMVDLCPSCKGKLDEFVESLKEKKND